MANKSPDNKQTQIAFLLSQVGGRSAQEFAHLLGPLQLAPPDAGILRIVRQQEGISQQNLAKTLRMHPSRLVALIDALEMRGLVKREPHASDRRLYSLRLTAEGQEVLRSMGELAREHNKIMCAGLSAAECAQLEGLLEKVAKGLGLAPGVHPGYRDVGRAKRRQGRSS
jgi:DNA-binding MarR family transcriptional regulator